MAMAHDVPSTQEPDDRIFAACEIPPAMADAFALNELAKRRQVLTVGLLLGMVLFPGFVFLDYQLMPDILMLSALLRIGIALPLATLLLLAIRRNVLSLRTIELSVCSLMWLVAAMVSFFAGISRAGSGGMIVSATGVDVILMFLTVIFQPPIRYAAVTSVLMVCCLGGCLAISSQITSAIWSGLMALAVATMLPALYANWYIGNERKRQFLSTERDRALLSELSAQNEKLDKLSASDPLTGLPNRRAFDRALDAAIARASSDGLMVAVAMIDIDHFKRYNDHYGHIAGDVCLRNVALALASAVSEAGFAARVGGEEFALILDCPDPSLLPLVGERLRLAVANLGLPHAGLTTSGFVSISVGVSHSGRGLIDPAGLLEAADRALYDVKRTERGRVVVDRSATGRDHLRRVA